MSNIRAIICIGISASGKTTWAREKLASDPENWAIVSRDDIRTDLQGGTLDWSKWNWKDEDKVTVNHCLALRQARDSNKNIIVADTNLKQKTISDLSTRLRALGYDIEYKIFDIDGDEAILRDKLRGSLSVGQSVIQKQIESFKNLKASFSKM